jgi:hypothetical protein
MILKRGAMLVSVALIGVIIIIIQQTVLVESEEKNPSCGGTVTGEKAGKAKRSPLSFQD